MRLKILFINTNLIALIIIFTMFKQELQTILPIQLTRLLQRSNFACQPSSSVTSYRIELLKVWGLVWNAQ